MRLRETLVIAVAFVVLVVSQLAIDDQPEKIETVRANPYQNLPPTDYLTEYLSTMLIGGFKPIAVDFLWMKCATLEEDKQFQEIKTILVLISSLQPWSEQVWSYIAWNLAFNLAHQAESPEEKYRWVKEGIEYAKRGVERNPSSAKLRHDVGFLYYYRVPQSADLKRRVLQETGRDCYEHAREWFESGKRQAVGMIGRRYEFDSMILDCSLHHIFEDVARQRYAEAIEESRGASAHARSIAKIYGQHVLFWERRARVPEESIPAIETDRRMWEADHAGRPEECAQLRDEAFRRYSALLQTFLGLNLDAVEDRMDALLVDHVIEEVFPRCDRGDAAAVAAILDQVALACRRAVSAEHPSTPYWNGRAQRWIDFKKCAVAEAEAQAATLTSSPDAAAKWAEAVEEHKHFGENYDGLDLEWAVERQRVVETRAAAAGVKSDLPQDMPAPPAPR